MNKISEEKQEMCNYRKTSLYQKYSKKCYRVGGYPWDRDAQSDRNKRVRHIASKSLRRGLERESQQIIRESLED